MPSVFRKVSKTSALRLTGSVGSFGLLLFLLQKQGWGEIIRAFRSIPIWCILACCALMMVSRLATGVRWYVLLRGLGVEMPFRRSMEITFAGLFASNFLPSTVGGDAARLAALMQLGYSGSKSAASVVLDRLVGLLGMVVAIPFGLPAFTHVLRFHMPFHKSSMLACPQVAAISGGGIAGKVKGILGRMLRALLQGATRPYHLFGAIVCTWVHMLATFGFFALLFVVMGEPVPFATIAGLWTIVYFVTLVPISINGLGVQELSVVYVFSHMGVSTATATAAALLYRTIMMLASTPGAAFVPSIMAGKSAPVPEFEDVSDEDADACKV